MNIVSKTITDKIRAAFAPEFLELTNESYLHSVPEHSETHFKLVLASNAFAEVSTVKRHQMVYSLLAEEMAAGVHALALHLYTPEQWLQRSQTAPESPQCMGGSKA